MRQGPVWIAFIAVIVNIVFAGPQWSSAQAEESADPKLAAELGRLDSFLHAQRGAASPAAFADFEAAIKVFREDMDTTRTRLPTELTDRFDTSIATEVARIVDGADDMKTADYRCFVAAQRTLEQSRVVVCLPLLVKRMDLKRLDEATRQYDELLERFTQRTDVEPGRISNPHIPRALREAGHNLLASGFGVVLSESQRQRVEAILDAEAARLNAGASERGSIEAVKAKINALQELYAVIDGSAGTRLTTRLATLAWSNKHGALEKSVWEGIQEAQKAEVAAIQAMADREVQRVPEEKKEPEAPPEL